MGIKYLTSFIEDNITFEKVDLSDFEAVVIDGNNICHRLYEHCDWQMGGEYPEFYSKVKEFFEKILRAGVRPTVVFDGLRDERKTKTVCQRIQGEKTPHC